MRTKLASKVCVSAVFSVLVSTFGIQYGLAAPDQAETNKRSSKSGSVKKLSPFSNPFLFGMGGSIEETDYKKAFVRLDDLMKKHPDLVVLPHGKAQLLIAKGDRVQAIDILKKIIALELKLGKRYSGPYIDLARTYEALNQRGALLKLLPQMLERFSDNEQVVLEVNRINSYLKDKQIARLTRSALVTAKSALENADRSLETMQPPKPVPIKPGECLAMAVSTRCFPKFRLYVTNDRTLGDSGIARYMIAPPDYSKLTFYDPESERYTVVGIPVLIKNHCGDDRPSVPYSKVKRVESATILNHKCTVYQCTHVGEDDYDLVYLSDSIKLAPGLIRPMAQLYQIPDMTRVPIKIVSHEEGYGFPRLTVFELKQSRTPMDKFTLPKTAKKMNSINDVMFDNEIMDTIFK